MIDAIIEQVKERKLHECSLSDLQEIQRVLFIARKELTRLDLAVSNAIHAREDINSRD